MKSFLGLACLLLVGSASAQSHLINTDVVKQGSAKITLQATNVGISNPKTGVAFSFYRNTELSIAQGFWPGNTYFNGKVRVLNTHNLSLVAGVYDYTPRGGVVNSYLASSYQTRYGKLNLGALFHDSYVEMHYGFNKPVYKNIGVVFDYQSSVGNNSDILYAGLSIHVANNLHYYPGLYIKDIDHPKFFPGCNVTVSF